MTDTTDTTKAAADAPLHSTVYAARQLPDVMDIADEWHAMIDVAMKEKAP